MIISYDNGKANKIQLEGVVTFNWFTYKGAPKLNIKIGGDPLKSALNRFQNKEIKLTVVLKEKDTSNEIIKTPSPPGCVDCGAELKGMGACSNCGSNAC